MLVKKVKKLAAKKDSKNKQKKFGFALIILVLCIGLGLSIFHIIRYKLETNSTNKQLGVVEETIKIEETDSENEEVVEQEEKDDLYWKYINMNLINVDFSELKSINKDTKGWIQVKGTNINYPFVQTSNNDYYLTHSFNRTYNSAGWVFLDYRNNLANMTDKNTIIYAHGRLDNTMFGSLKNILSSNWLKNSDNFIVRLSTEYENTLWQVFSVYRIPTTSDYLQTTFNSDSEFKDFTNILIGRSGYNFNTNVSENGRILTLSTCYSDKDKVVLHAKLLKRETR